MRHLPAAQRLRAGHGLRSTSSRSSRCACGRSSAAAPPGPRFPIQGTGQRDALVHLHRRLQPRRDDARHRARRAPQHLPRRHTEEVTIADARASWSPLLRARRSRSSRRAASRAARRGAAPTSRKLPALGFAPRVACETGCAKTVAWYATQRRTAARAARRSSMTQHVRCKSPGRRNSAAASSSSAARSATRPTSSRCCSSATCRRSTRCRPIGAASRRAAGVSRRSCCAARACQLVQLGLVVDPAILFPPEYPYTAARRGSCARTSPSCIAKSRRSTRSDRATSSSTSARTTARCSATFTGGGHRVLGIEPTNARQARASARHPDASSRSSTARAVTQRRRRAGPGEGRDRHERLRPHRGRPRGRRERARRC